MELNRVIIYRQSESSSNNCSIIFVWVSFSILIFFFLQIWFGMCWLIKHSLKIIFRQWILLKWAQRCSANHVEDSTNRRVWLPGWVYSTYTCSKDVKGWITTPGLSYKFKLGSLLVKAQWTGFFDSSPPHVLFGSSRVAGSRCSGQPWHGAASLSASRCVAVRRELHWQCCGGKFVQPLPALTGAVIIFLLCVRLLNICLIFPSFLPLQQVSFGLYP